MLIRDHDVPIGDHDLLMGGQLVSILDGDLRPAAPFSTRRGEVHAWTGRTPTFGRWLSRLPPGRRVVPFDLAARAETDEDPPVRVAPPWFVYVARCSDATLYVGIALDVAARIAAHDAGKGARYTRGRGPLSVLATRRCKTKGDALRLELALKRLTRVEKLALVSAPRKLAAFARRALAA